MSEEVKRLHELLHEKNRYLVEGESLIYIKDGKMAILHSDEESLSRIDGKVPVELIVLLHDLMEEA